MKTTLLKTTIFGLSLALLGMMPSCNEEETPSKVAEVTTGPAEDLDYFTATVSGNVTKDGGSAVTAKGIAYGTAPQPTIDSDTTNQGEGAGTFTSHLTDLTPGVTYYARAYAMNDVGIAYGEEITFNTVNAAPSLTLDATNVRYAQFTGTTTITSSGASAVLNSGIIYSTTNTEPTIADAFWSNDTDMLTIESLYKGLLPNTKYYVRAFANNSNGHGYSNTIEITTKSFPATVTDIDDNIYNTVLIGDRVWLASDLRVTRYNNGDAIGTTENDISGETSPKYQWPVNGDQANVPVYGRLYTYFAAQDSRKVCPSGTRMATSEDWSDVWNATQQAGKLKTTGTTNWQTPNTGATNVTGFNSVGAGYRASTGAFNQFQQQVYYLSMDLNGDETTVYSYNMKYNDNLMWGAWPSVKNGNSVRCVVND